MRKTYTMVHKLFLFTFILSTLLLFGCYPQEIDMIEVVDVETPIDTIQISEGVSKFIIAETEFRREGFGRYCESVDEFTGETITEALIFNGSPIFQEGIFALELNDVAILDNGNSEELFILISSDAEGEKKLYRSMGENSSVLFTTNSDTEVRGIWEGSFEKEVSEDVWQEFGVISGEFFVPVIEVDCE